MRDRAPIPAPIVTSPTHCLSHTRWRHSCLQCNAEESAQLSSAPRGGRQPDRHLLLLQTSAGSSSSRKRCARHTMSIAVCVRVSAVQYAHVPPAYCMPLTPPTTYRLLSAVYRLRPAGCRLLPAPTTYRLPPAACRLRLRMPPGLHTYRLPPASCIRPCTPIAAQCSDPFLSAHTPLFLPQALCGDETLGDDSSSGSDRSGLSGCCGSEGRCWMVDARAV
jgi:hypothetical protein